LRSRPLAAVVLLVGCSGGPTLTREELLDPETCQSCHPRHYREWSGSMHAYAADDPVFLAMNRRGQEETGGDLGDFCVSCHAPMAVIEGATFDGLNLDEVPQHLKGVTCFFCHTVDAVEGDHNNPLRLADDLVMRGGFGDGIRNPAHDMAYSPLHDRRNLESSRMCGACHDIVTPAGVHLERTFVEWQESFFNRPHAQGGLTCGNCHMPGFPDQVVAEFDGVPSRTFHEHAFPGVDVAITPWPEREEQLRLIKRDLDPSILPILCWTPVDGGRIQYTLDNIGGGHMIPSGAAQDRRMWVELRAYSSDDVVLESGAVADGQPVTDVAETDPHLWQIRDFTFKENGEEAHMFWDVREVRSELLKPVVTLDPLDPDFIHSTTREYPLSPMPDRITAVVHLRPIGLDVLDDLIATGHLDPVHRDAGPTFTIEGTRLEWTPEKAGGDLCVTRAD
jgi:hypothetical protein